MPVPVTSVMAAVIEDDEGRILIAQRPDGKHMAGMWEFPGGKPQPGELPEATLKRELMEELGITVKRADMVPLTFVSHSYPEFHLLMLVYHVRLWQGEATALEHKALRWVDPRSLGTYQMPPADAPIVELLTALYE